MLPLSQLRRRDEGALRCLPFALHLCPPRTLDAPAAQPATALIFGECNKSVVTAAESLVAASALQYIYALHVAAIVCPIWNKGQANRMHRPMWSHVTMRIRHCTYHTTQGGRSMDGGTVLLSWTTVDPSERRSTVPWYRLVSTREENQ